MKFCNLLASGSFIVLAVTLLVSCAPMPHSDVEPADLLIDLTVMPSNWYVLSSSSNPIDDYFRYESGADNWFNGKTNEALIVAAHHVFRLPSEKRAARIYTRELPAEFNSSSVASVTPWQMPEELPYQSVVADRFHFACHISNINFRVEICKQWGNMTISW